ncbi:MAG: hypothetical protein GF393_02395, partial [Armatimonadia bacterium]|nr:hypothetical protein [Armatimonadia bacterium]
MRVVALGLMAVMLLAGMARAQEEVTPVEDLYRVTIPDELPPHPRVFCTQAD